MARVTAQQNTGSHAKAGVMIRESLDAGAKEVSTLLQPPTRGALLLNRSSTGGTTSAIDGPANALPYWVRLTRTGDAFTAATSADGQTWTDFGSTTVAMNPSALVGLAVCSTNNAVLSSSVLDNVLVTDLPEGPLGSVTVTPTSGLQTTEAGGTATFSVKLDSAPTADVTIGLSSSDTTEGTVAPASLTFTATNWATAQTVTVTGVDDVLFDGNVAYSVVTGSTSSTDLSYSNLSVPDVAVTNLENDPFLPTPWQQSDVGAVGVPGTGTYAAGVFSIQGSGADIYGTADAFHFVYQSIQGDSSITAHVASQENTGTGAKAGVMIRSSLAANSAFADVVATPGGRIFFYWRTSDGGSTSYAVAYANAPIWVRLTRTGNSFSAFYSADGIAWTQIGVARTLNNINATALAGLAVSAVNNTVLNTSTFDNVTVVGTPPTPPGVTVNPAMGLQTTEAGGTATFGVKLNSQPAADVTIALSGSDATEGAVSPASLTFTAQNWSTEQSVTLTGVNDAASDGDIAYSVALAISSGDGFYNGLTVAPVGATNTDDDLAISLAITRPDDVNVANEVFPTIGGTAAGVVKVEFKLKHTATNLLWNGSTWVPVPPPAPAWLPATFDPETGVWQSNAPLPTGDLLFSGRYIIAARGTDAAGQVLKVFREIRITPSALTLAIYRPVGTISNVTTFPILRATVAGEGSQVGARVQFALQKAGSGRFWNGLAFVDGLQLLPAAFSEGLWRSSGPLPSGALLKGGLYRVLAFLVDANGGRRSASADFALVLASPLAVSAKAF